MATRRLGPRRIQGSGLPRTRHPLSQHPPSRHPLDRLLRPAPPPEEHIEPAPPSGKYRDPNKVIEKLIVDEGVFRPNAGSIALAEVSLEHEGRFLDVGTGTGFCAAYLALNGGKGDASDWSDRALECAGKNFGEFGIKPEDVGLIKSDLYGDIKGKYDRISFSPPTNPRSEGEGGRRVKTWITDHTPRLVSRLLAKPFKD